MRDDLQAAFASQQITKFVAQPLVGGQNGHKAGYGAIAGDWESGAIAWVAKRNSVRCLILRGVTDLVSEQSMAGICHIALPQVVILPILCYTAVTSQPEPFTCAIFLPSPTSAKPISKTCLTSHSS